MRFADVLLMYAEVMNELFGPDAIGTATCGKTGRDALMEVHCRAFDTADQSNAQAYVNGISSADFFDAVVDERAWEFGGEKLRRFDLARWNLYGKTVYNLYHNWITIGRVAHTKVTKDFDQPISGTPFDDYPAKVYYKLIPANGTGVTDQVEQVIEYYTEDGINSYDQSLPVYPDNPPVEYTQGNMCTIFLKEVKDDSGTRIGWAPADGILYAFYGYINENNAGTVDPETDPVRYFAPIPTDALSSHQGLLKNYYGFN